MSDWIKVCGAQELALGQFRTVDADGTQIVVFNLGGDFFAIEDVCTHDGGRLTGGHVEDGEIVCPRHGARFCIKSGAALTPPAYEATATFPVRVEDETIEVRDDRWD